MKFTKDILFFGITTTGDNTDKDNILQLAGILIDKDSLLEKDNFNSYIRASYLENIINEHTNFLRIDPHLLKTSPKIYDAIKQFNKQFDPSGLVLAAHNTSDIIFLKNAYKKAVVPYKFDPHSLQLWTLGYIYTLHYGIKKLPTLNTFLDFFKLKMHNPYDAMEKIRMQIEVFKKIIKEV